MSRLERVLTIVEQLHRATEEFRTDHPTNNRLALILIDNAAELIIQNHCVDRLESNEFWSRISMAKRAIAKARPSESDNSDLETITGTPPMTEKQRRAAKGQHLGDKLKLLVSMGDITQLERRFIAISHDYRNELYHAGFAHDEVIRPMAGRYFLLSCDLFVRLGNLSVWKLNGSRGEIRAEAARLYFPAVDDGPMSFEVDKDDVAKRLRHALQGELPNLSKSLAESAGKHITEAKKNFESIERDNPLGLHGNKLLEFIQWEHDLREALEREKVDGLWWDPEYVRNVSRVAGELRPTWTQKHTSVPIGGWLRQADRIGQTDDPLLATQLYGFLVDNMSYLSDVINAAADDLDRWIQNEIDRIRGK